MSKILWSMVSKAADSHVTPDLRCSLALNQLNTKAFSIMRHVQSGKLGYSHFGHSWSKQIIRHV